MSSQTNQNNQDSFYANIRDILEQTKMDGLFKNERLIATKQGAIVELNDGTQLINLCANNYLGLSSHPSVIAAAHEALEQRGFGLSSVRFICGTQDRHKELESRLAKFLGTEDVILYGSAFDANGGLFETILTEQDAVISDELNHASIIDGIRLSKAKRFRYKNCDMADLEKNLQDADAAGARYKLVFTDGVFSMDGTIAKLGEIRALCDKYNALLGVDDSHATGFVGRTGRGTHELCNLFGKIDIITGTLGKALGGASGGFTAAKKEVVELLRQRSRPYLFSNTLAPTIVGATLAVLDILEGSTQLRDTLENNAKFFRDGLTKLGFNLRPGHHPIIPVMIGDAELSQKFSAKLLENGVYAVGFFYPVVPKNLARIRTQLSAAHTEEELNKAIKAFETAGRELGII